MSSMSIGSRQDPQCNPLPNDTCPSEPRSFDGPGLRGRDDIRGKLHADPRQPAAGERLDSSLGYRHMLLFGRMRKGKKRGSEGALVVLYSGNFDPRRLERWTLGPRH